MATTLAPAINITNASKGMNSLNAGLENLKKSSDTIKTVTLNRTKIKKESFARDRILTNMREESVRRKDQESIIEASGISGAFKRTASVITDSTKGFLGRVLDFASSLLIGWLLYNLPTIMTGIEDLITRIKSLYGLLTDFMANIKDTFQNFGNLLSGVYYNISNFDFTDDSKRVQSAMDDLNVNLETMRDQFLQGFDILNKPLGEGPGEEPVPEVNTDYTQDGPTSGGDVSGYGTKEQQALLKTIRFAEGTAGPTGYSMFFGDKYGKSKYGDLTKLSANEVEKLVTKFLNDPQSRYDGGKSAAVGAFQIIDITGKARALGMDMNRKFDQNFQDEMALRLAASRGVTAEVLKREGLSDSVIKKLSPEWASFPGNTYGQPTKRSQDLKSTYQSSLSSPTKPTQSGSGSSQSSGSGKIYQYLHGERGRTGYEPAQHWNHDHFSFTSRAAAVKAFLALKQKGFKPYEFEGYGRKMPSDSHSPSGGHFGPAGGKPTYNDETDGTAFDIPYSSYGSGPIGPNDYKKSREAHRIVLEALSGNTTQNEQPGISKPTTPPTPLAQVSPTTLPGQNVPAVAQDKKGQEVVVIDDRQPSAPQQVSVGSGSQPQMIPTESSLNSLIKNQILLELAYT